MKTAVKKQAAVAAHTIKAGLAMIIPVLFIGSIAVLLNGFPLQSYQDFLDSFLGGAPRSIIITIQNSTIGSLAIYITIAISLSFMKQTGGSMKPVFRFGSVLGCLTGFFILVGFFSGEPDLTLLSGQGVFSATIAGLSGSVMYRRFDSLFRRRRMHFVEGAESEFNASLYIILPFLCVALCFAVVNYLISECFKVQSMQHLFMKAMEMIFMRRHRSYSSGLLFIILAGIMWWFGIHGNNVLDQVATDMFAAIIPGETVSKSFMDVFVNMGGTGCTLGLLFALMFFGRRSTSKHLAGMALLPGIFNIGELVVFGFPVIYNPFMLIPFILAPTLCFTNAFLLTQAGFVPQVVNPVAWTTPALMGGYIATGSYKGMFVQLMNILISAACYAPFVVMNEKRSEEKLSSSMEKLVGILRESENGADKPVLTECEGEVGRLARRLAVELEASLVYFAKDTVAGKAENPLFIRYETMFDSEGVCIGAKVVPGWAHKLYGSIYLPLIIRIAEECGELYRLETCIAERAADNLQSFKQRFGTQYRLDIDISASTLSDDRLLSFLQSMADRYRLRAGSICFKLRDEMGASDMEKISARIERIRLYGYGFTL